MRRPLVGVTLALVALAVAPAVASATHSNGQGPKHDFANGTGHFVGPTPIGQTDIRMHVNARSGPLGENPTGRFFAHRVLPTGLHVHGDVTCLTVVGNQAVVGGRITRGREPRFPFVEEAGILIQVDDNGEGQVLPDRMHGDPYPFPPMPGVLRPPTVCPPPVGPARLPVQEGNFTVHDALP